ncbi:MAG: lasso peptide biosynthesis B2 protein [Bradymonadaceae bacterium]|nr:lasso peptide biosynthesis B2 protein [Lujinxingiaceae bacterium]
MRPTTPIHPIAQCEMGVLVLGARLLSPVLTLKQLVTLAHHAAEFAPPRALHRAQLSEGASLAAILANRASRLVPGTSCMHRAVAARLWLARRGIAGRIVIGFRKRGWLEGHAWLEISTDTDPIYLFKSESDGYSRSLDEDELVGAK